MKFFVRTALVSAIMAVSAPALALTATQTVKKEVVTVDPFGVETITYETAELVVPGERLAYELDYMNDQAEPATDLVLTMPIPDVVEFAEGSARGKGTVITYSVDGTNFYDREALMMGETAASAEDITHIRWVIVGPVAPGEAGKLAFSGTLK